MFVICGWLTNLYQYIEEVPYQDFLEILKNLIGIQRFQLFQR